MPMAALANLQSIQLDWIIKYLATEPVVGDINRRTADILEHNKIASKTLQQRIKVYVSNSINETVSNKYKKITIKGLIVEACNSIHIHIDQRNTMP